MSFNLFLFVLLAFFMSCSTMSPVSPPCVEANRFEEVKKNEGERRYSLSVWTGTQNEFSSSCLCQSESVEKYRQKIQNTINTDPYFLLERYTAKGDVPEDLHNLQEVLKKRIGEIREMSCIESFLLERQLERNQDMLTAPTEFLAYFLVRNDQHKILAFTNDSLGVG